MKVTVIASAAKQSSPSIRTSLADGLDCRVATLLATTGEKWQNLLCFAVFLLTLALPITAAPKPIVADLSSHEITIHTSFEGAELILFGARNDAGDIVVVVRGPAREATVRRKAHVAGMWINRESESFPSIPGFYAMAASRPYAEITKSPYFAALGIGEEAAIRPLTLTAVALPSHPDFSQALLAQLRSRRLYAGQPGKVEFVGETLFKATIPFPDNMPRGKYTAEVYLFAGGLLVGEENLAIDVHKSGFDAFVYDKAQHHPLLYGLFAVGLALFCGWFASYVARRL